MCKLSEAKRGTNRTMHGLYRCISSKVRACGVFAADGEQTACERDREAAQASSSSSGGYFFFRPRPAVGQYVPSCDAYGAYEALQCHASIGQCWCVDSSGQEISGSRTEPGSRPMCKSTDRLHITHWLTRICVLTFRVTPMCLGICIQYITTFFYFRSHYLLLHFCIYLFRFCHILFLL